MPAHCGPVSYTHLDVYKRQKLIDVGTAIVNDGFQPEGRGSSELLAKAESEVFAIAEGHSRGRQDFVPIKRALNEAFDVLQKRAESGSGVTGLPTGYVAVSYTHLDVYKRQVCANRALAMC